VHGPRGIEHGVEAIVAGQVELGGADEAHGGRPSYATEACRYYPAARDELHAAIRYGEAGRPGRGVLLEAAVGHALRRFRRLLPLATGARHPEPLEIRRARVNATVRRGRPTPHVGCAACGAKAPVRLSGLLAKARFAHRRTDARRPFDRRLERPDSQLQPGAEHE